MIRSTTLLTLETNNSPSGCSDGCTITRRGALFGAGRRGIWVSFFWKIARSLVTVMDEAYQVNIVKLFFVTLFKRSASLRGSVAVCLQSLKNNFWFNLWAVCLPSLPESFRVLVVPALLLGAGGVARVVGVDSGFWQQANNPGYLSSSHSWPLLKWP